MLGPKGNDLNIDSYFDVDPRLLPHFGRSYVQIMAKRIIETFTDDIDGSEDATPIRFSYAGTDYAIDLGEQNQKVLEDALAPFISAATKVRSSFKATGKRGKVPTSEIRAWGKTLPKEDQERLFPSDRGALRKEALAAYNDVHGTSF